jgi:DNA-binding CsgD family transcriptional regulator
MKALGMQNGVADELPMRLGQVADLIALGYSDKQIAVELQLSPRTIHRHVVRLLERLGVENRAAAAAVWARRTMARDHSSAGDAATRTEGGDAAVTSNGVSGSGSGGQAST